MIILAAYSGSQGSGTFLESAHLPEPYLLHSALSSTPAHQRHPSLWPSLSSTSMKAWVRQATLPVLQGCRAYQPGSLKPVIQQGVTEGQDFAHLLFKKPGLKSCALLKLPVFLAKPGQTGRSIPFAALFLGGIGGFLATHSGSAQGRGLLPRPHGLFTFYLGYGNLSHFSCFGRCGFIPSRVLCSLSLCLSVFHCPPPPQHITDPSFLWSRQVGRLSCSPAISPEPYLPPRNTMLLYFGYVFMFYNDFVSTDVYRNVQVLYRDTESEDLKSKSYFTTSQLCSVQISQIPAIFYFVMISSIVRERTEALELGGPGSNAASFLVTSM